MPGSEENPSLESFAQHGQVGRTFVGRERELSELRASLASVAGGRGQLFCLIGEPGIGKTRLTEEIAADAERAGAKVAWGRCWEGGGAPAYWPWMQALRHCARTIDSRAADSTLPSTALQMLGLTPESRGEISSPENWPRPTMLSGLPSRGRSTFDPARFELFDSIAAYLKRLSSASPLVLVLDDLHAADADSLHLLRFVARDLLQSKILILATYRGTEVRLSAEHAQLLSSIGREGRTIHLGGLSEKEVAAFARSNAALTPNDRLVSKLCEVTEGNPFFLDETLRLLLANPEAGAKDRVAAALAIPDSVHEAIRKRVAPLSGEARDTIEIASVIGREFDIQLLSQVSALPPPECIARLAEGVSHGIIKEYSDAAGRFRFSHAMIPETLAADLPRLRQMQLHQQIAQALESLHPDDLIDYLPQLAEHYARSIPGGTRDKAVEFAVRGARRAMQQLAYEEGARLYQLALDALAAPPALEQAESCGLMVELGEALSRAGYFDRAREVFARAAALARKSNDSDALARAALGVGIPSSRAGTVDGMLVELLEEALRTSGEADSAQKAMLIARLAAALYWSDQRARSVELSRNAVEIARRLDNPSALIYALCMWHYSLWGPDNLDARLKTAQEMVQLAERIKDPQWALRALEMHLADLLETGAMQEADADLKTYKELSEKTGGSSAMVELSHTMRSLLHGESSMVELTNAMRALLRGDLGEGERLAEHAMVVGQRRQEPRALLSYAAQVSFIRFEQRRMGELEPMLRAYVEQYPVLDVARSGLALAHVEAGREAEARVQFDYLAREDFAALRRDWNWLATMAILTTICVFIQDRERAARIYELMLPYAERNTMIGWTEVCYGSASRYLGNLAALMQRYDDAQRHYEAAISMNAKIGARGWLAHSQHEYAAMLIERGKDEDRARALELNDQALASAELLGLTALQEQARALKTKHGTGAKQSPRRVGESTRTLETILYFDIVGSTGHAVRLGDRQWGDQLGQYYSIVRKTLAAFRGREISNPGDGFLALFDAPAEAVAAVFEIRTAASALGMQLRAGLHCGECVWVGDQAVGIALHIGARIATTAEPDQVLVSSTVRDLVAGSGMVLTDAGSHRLRGVPEEWRLYRVDSVARRS
jgi:eukaryotic-like serine/threonine-protein kinase